MVKQTTVETFINGKADNGGAIYCGNAYNCTFTGNEGSGAISGSEYYKYVCIAYNCTFTKNIAKDSLGQPLWGGAIYMCNATNCIFTNNTAEKGGAIYRGNATNCTFCCGNAFNCNFTQNKAKIGGGAISCGNAYNCTFTNNKAERSGGAISGGMATCCIFISNIAERYGGAIHNVNATNCTFNENIAKISGGAMNVGNAYNCNFTHNKAEKHGGAINNVNVSNSIFAENYVKNKNNKYSTCGGAMYGGNAYNCNFTHNKACKSEGGGRGGAIANGNAYNCRFTKNWSWNTGGALYKSNAYNCIFEDCRGRNDWGSAMHKGTACLCKFNGGTTRDTKKISPKIVASYVMSYSDDKANLKLYLKANNQMLNGINITAKFYKDNVLYTERYALSGEILVLDLEPGQYTLELSLTDYPKEKSSKLSTTFTIGKTSTTFDINPMLL